MVKFNKKMDKEYGAIGRALKPVNCFCQNISFHDIMNLQRPSSSGIDLKMLRAKSLEPVSSSSIIKN